MNVGRATTDSARVRLRQILIGAQIAFATMLLVGAALLLQGFVRLQRVPLGFDPNDVLTARISLPRNDGIQMPHGRGNSTNGSSIRSRNPGSCGPPPWAPARRLRRAYAPRFGRLVGAGLIRGSRQ